MGRFRRFGLEREHRGGHHFAGGSDDDEYVRTFERLLALAVVFGDYRLAEEDEVGFEQAAARLAKRRELFEQTGFDHDFLAALDTDEPLGGAVELQDVASA